MRQPAVLALENGLVFHGESIGAIGHSVGEVVFNTSMTGYQEILTDPSYCQQIVTLTYPHIGNTGVNPEDIESDKVFASGLIIRDLPLLASNWRCNQTLSHYLIENNVVSISGIDTRKLTRVLREQGAQSGCILAGDGPDVTFAIDKARAFPGLKGMDLAQKVSTDNRYLWQQGVWSLSAGYRDCAVSDPAFHVVAYDFGVKHNILRILAERGCRITVVPARTSASEVMALNPDGVFLSNGPGDPEPCTYAINSIRSFLDGGVPLFGICLGHQLLALASGARTMKMKFGHHGANHPVVDVTSKKVMITSQNHGFAVDESSLPEHLLVTHQSLFDGSIQGIHHAEKPAFGFQGHPEASPGPNDASHLFDHFIELMSQAANQDRANEKVSA
ncbi:MAG: glutamine-hydrolyzing carbamoyl-phosphate synthase small subunit [Gammaproteobacteria bacterium]